MKLVVDTNILISAFAWGRLPAELLQAAVEHNTSLFTSPALLMELRDVIERPHIRTRLSLRGHSAQTAIDYYQHISLVVSPLTTSQVVQNDPDDDHVLAIAFAYQANIIVSGDAKHLLPLKSYQGIPIVNARSALQQIGML